MHVSEQHLDTSFSIRLVALWNISSCNEVLSRERERSHLENKMHFFFLRGGLVRSLQAEYVPIGIICIEKGPPCTNFTRADMNVYLS